MWASRMAFSDAHGALTAMHQTCRSTVSRVSGGGIWSLAGFLRAAFDFVQRLCMQDALLIIREQCRDFIGDTA